MATSDPHVQALSLARAGRLVEALAALEVAPETASGLALKASLLLEIGQTKAAARTAARATQVDPANARAHAALADALHALGRALDAVASYRQALTLRPGDAAAHANLGNVLHQLGRLDEALESYDQALAHDPRLTPVQANRARVLCELGAFGEALAAADRALAMDPANARAWQRRGEALAGLDRYEEALESQDKALALQPASYDAQVSRAGVLRALGRLDEAVAVLDRAEAADPDAPDAPYERAIARLTARDFAGGWRDYERRWRAPVFQRHSAGFVTGDLLARLSLHPSPADLAGRQVLVVGEQGLGDQLMHASLLPDLLGVAGEVAWACDRRLHSLLGASFPTVRFLDPRDEPLPLAAFPTIVAAGSLAGAFRRRIEDFPGEAYLTAPPAAVASWAERLGARDRRLRIGIAWRGGAAATGGAQRSMSLKALAPLLARDDCELVSLQHGAAAPAGVRGFPAEATENFGELAGLVANLDLVVTVQTALVHLAGALGRAALVMLPAVAEWRYGREGEILPWYRSVRLFRQPAPGAWEPVVEAVMRALDAG